MYSQINLKRLIPPLIFECFLSTSLGLIDTIMISSVGEAAVSGVSLVDMLNVFFINLFNGLATGGAVIAAQFIGKKNRKRASDCATEIIILLFGVSVVITTLTLVFRAQFLRLIFGSLEADVFAAAKKYLTYSAVSYPFMAVYSASAALFRSMGNSRISMTSSLVMNILNIGGNATLIFGFGLGIDGAAIATISARFFAMLYLFICICNKKEEIHASFKGHRLDSSLIGKILFVGLPTCFENSVFQMGRILVVSIITTFGTVQIAANAVANNLDSFGCIPGQGMQLAMITVIGQCIGAGDDEQTLYYARKMMRLTYVLSAAANLLVITTMPLTLRLYPSLSREALELAFVLVLIHTGIGILIWPSSFVLPNILKAGGDARFTMAVSMISMVVMRIVFSYILAVGFGLGAIGVWISMIMDWIFRSAFFFVRYKKGKWLHGMLV